ncbi:hypothetical protein O7626_13095 [Micromonospora sp. WMMD1102]|uniref:hypothetical protein n=1 Tax=Micromonospora sp. WMMD1102 TaxID=3016105 RepID=UPI002414E17E|nr:hypothetical protein [Micromonospora sp. WMMD1102]MDG4786854.1 hypothetical protein [Micromonospora sp. WMMD1102]
MTLVEGTGDPLAKVLDEIGQRRQCRLLPPAGPPLVPVGLPVPDDLRLLYERCGGAILFEGSPFAWRVSGPRKLVAASPRLLSHELADEIAIDDPTDVTTGCHVIADGGTGASTEPHIVVDLHPDRSGRCYATGWDTYGLVGDMPVVARDITELLQRLLDTDGVQSNLPGRDYGDAYD